MGSLDAKYKNINKYQVSHADWIRMAHSSNACVEGAGYIRNLDRLLKDIRVELEEHDHLKVLHFQCGGLTAEKWKVIQRLMQSVKPKIVVLTEIKKWAVPDQEYDGWFCYTTTTPTLPGFKTPTRAGLAVLVKQDAAHVDQLGLWQGVGLWLRIRYKASKFLVVNDKKRPKEQPRPYEEFNLFAAYWRPKCTSGTRDDWSMREDNLKQKMYRTLLDQFQRTGHSSILVGDVNVDGHRALHKVKSIAMDYLGNRPTWRNPRKDTWHTPDICVGRHIHLKELQLVTGLVGSSGIDHVPQLYHFDQIILCS